MIKFTAGNTKTGRPLVGIGITAKNVEQLKLDRPINIWGVELGVPFDILLFYGETEQMLADQLRAAGMVDPEKTIVEDHLNKPKTRQ